MNHLENYVYHVRATLWDGDDMTWKIDEGDKERMEATLAEG
jgi:hypothetical protein